MKIHYFAAALLLCLPSTAGAKDIEPYKDSTLPAERRAADLLSRMTLDEKVAQLQCRWLEKADFLDDGEFSEKKARQAMPDGIGTLARMNEDYHPGFKPYFTTRPAGASARQFDRATPDYDEAGKLALMAGVDCELPSIKSYANLAKMVREGRLEEAVVDSAVLRLLTEKFRLGLFEHPYVDADAAERLLGGAEGQALAYRAATESMVLLQNKDNVLPLDSTRIRTIALIGPNADRCVLGGYSNIPRHAISLRQAMERRFGSRMKIVCQEGVRIFESAPEYADIMHELSADDNAARISRAVEAAKQADAIVLCLGENDSIHREATSAYALGDLPTLDLLGGQTELVRRIAALGKPTVALVSSGTTLNLAPVAEQVPAIVQCWYLGQEGGYAMADALFGKVCPSGKLTISFPRSAGHVPCYYNYKPSSRRGYNLQKDVTPAYPFGFGLSYTTFEYSNLSLSSDRIAADGCATVAVDITNTGRREGTEVVQLYITDDYSLMPRPVKELRGFERVRLAPGEKRTVRFSIGPKELAAMGADFRRRVEPGTFTIQVGPSSAEGAKLTLHVGID